MAIDPLARYEAYPARAWQRLSLGCQPWIDQPRAWSKALRCLCQAKEKRENTLIEIPNNSRILHFTIYLPNLVYWVGFVTGVTFTMHLWIVDFIDFLTDNQDTIQSPQKNTKPQQDYTKPQKIYKARTGYAKPQKDFTKTYNIRQRLEKITRIATNINLALFNKYYSISNIENDID